MPSPLRRHAFPGLRTGASGFSLVELLVAVSIMLILAGTVAVALFHEPGKARVARARADIEALKAAVRIYESDNLAIPTQRQGLQALVECPTPAPRNWRQGGYLDRIDLPPDPWGAPYVYFVPGRHKEPFEIVSYGADGQPGGEDENADLSSSSL